MRVLHVVKTSEGASWAAGQAAVLTRLGVDVHVALPTLSGKAVSGWRASGVTVHEVDLTLPLRRPWLMANVLARARRLVWSVKPDIIHSHFVSTALALRWALGKVHPVRRIYQVAGPLHLEHPFYRRLELCSAGHPDVWIGSSRCVVNHYVKAGVPKERLFLSYYGFQTRRQLANRNHKLRRLAGASAEDIVVGNISYMYPPKRYLGHRVGLKCHEDLIDALGIVTKENPRVLGILVGGAWGGATWYEQKLRRRARSIGASRIYLPGRLSPEECRDALRDFDLVVHVPLSENCGGVVEPLWAGTPTIASKVGGLPEVVMPGVTGWLVPARRVRILARVIRQVLEQPEQALLLAKRGQALVETMFDVERTGREVFNIYQHVLDRRKPRPRDFDSREFFRCLQ